MFIPPATSRAGTARRAIPTYRTAVAPPRPGKVGTSRRDVPARVSAGGTNHARPCVPRPTLRRNLAARTARRAIPTLALNTYAFGATLCCGTQPLWGWFKGDLRPQSAFGNTCRFSATVYLFLGTNIDLMRSHPPASKAHSRPEVATPDDGGQSALAPRSRFLSFLLRAALIPGPNAVARRPALFLEQVLDPFGRLLQLLGALLADVLNSLADARKGFPNGLGDAGQKLLHDLLG